MTSCFSQNLNRRNESTRIPKISVILMLLTLVGCQTANLFPEKQYLLEMVEELDTRGLPVRKVVLDPNHEVFTYRFGKKELILGERNEKELRGFLFDTLDLLADRGFQVRTIWHESTEPAFHSDASGYFVLKAPSTPSSAEVSSLCRKRDYLLEIIDAFGEKGMKVKSFEFTKKNGAKTIFEKGHLTVLLPD